MRAAEEPIYKDAYIARKSSSSAAEGSKRGEKDAPLPGWVEVVRAIRGAPPRWPRPAASAARFCPARSGSCRLSVASVRRQPTTPLSWLFSL